MEKNASVCFPCSLSRDQFVQKFKSLNRIQIALCISLFFLSLLGLPHHHRVVNNERPLLLLQIETLQQENISLKKQAQKLKEQFQQQKVSLPSFLALTVHDIMYGSLILGKVRRCQGEEPLHTFIKHSSGIYQLARADTVVGGCIV